MEWLEKLRQRWNLTSYRQVALVLAVFICTGCTVLLIKHPILDFLFGYKSGERSSQIIYYLLILPVYNLLLLAYGFIFGQFYFFWNFEKRFFKRIFSKFRNHKQS